MLTLFPLAPVFPRGFTYHPDFITPDEERLLLETVVSMDLHTFKFHGYEGKRKVTSFGYDYSFERNTLSRGADIPSEFNGLIKKVSNKLSLLSEDFAELLVTEYPVGSVINWHRDAKPFDIVVGISLMSDCTFRLRPHDKGKQSRSAILSFPVERRSLYVIQGEARSAWQHSIAPVKAVRYSITLRTLANQRDRI